MSNPLVSVIVACYNGADYLEGCVRSLQNQKADLELIVVDDGSTDNSRQIAKSLAAQVPFEMIVVCVKNRGPAAARNVGIRMARGKYVGFLDVDDQYAPGFFANIVPILDRDPAVAGVFCEIELVNTHRAVEPWQREAMERTMPSNIVIRAEAVRQVGGFPEDPAFRGPTGGEDGAFRSELSRYGKIVKVNRPLYRYNVRPNAHLDYFLDRSYLDDAGRIKFRWQSPEEKDGRLHAAIREFRDTVQQRNLDSIMVPLQTSVNASLEFQRLAQRFEAVEGFLHPSEGFALYSLARRWPVEGAVVEIGSFKGRSTCWLATACRDSQRSKVVAVDPFRGAPEQCGNGTNANRDVAAPGSTLPAFRRNIEEQKLTEWVTTRVSTSVEASKGWDGPIRLLFIDDEHSAQAVREDFLAWSRFVALNGLVVFHDIGVSPEVTHFYGELCSEKRGWKELARFHTLGILQRTGKDGSAAAKLKAEEARLREILGREPEQVDTLYKLGHVLERQKSFDEAIAAFRKVLELQPSHAEAHNLLGILLARQQQFDEAIQHFQSFIESQPKRAAGFHNMAVACVDREQVAESIAHFDSAIRLEPEHAEAHKGKGMALLKMGRFREGWEEYEWRWRCKDLVPMRSPRPQWNGESIEGKTILLHCEQGLGDTLQFIRYAAKVKSRGATVIVACPALLTGLLRTCPGIDRIVSRKTGLPPHDVHIPLLSLPRIFGTDLANVSHNVPYLRADPARVQAWRNELAKVKEFKIGIAWQGNTKHLNDASRSIPLTQYKILADIPGVRLFSLQVGKGTDQLQQIADKFELTALHKRIDGAFVETAAAMRNLDLVICCDTSVAHLAGALAVPVWVALPFAADWRWLQKSEGSPWYPTMRLFRQRQLKDWQEVFERIAQALHAEVQKPRGASADIISYDTYRYADQPITTLPNAIVDALLEGKEAPARMADAMPMPSAPGTVVVSPEIGHVQKLLREQKHPQAEQFLHTFLNDHPDNADAWFFLALAQQGQNRLAEAIESFRRALRIRSDHADTHANLGIALCRARKLREGEAALREAIRIQPNFAKAYNNLGVVLAEMGKRPEALACWKETIRLDPKYPEGYFNAAVGLAEAKQFDDAAQHYDKALELRPDYAEAYSNLGLLLVEQSRPAEAVVPLEHAIRLKPDFVDAYNNLGLALADLGRTEEAVNCYREALKRRPKFAEVYNNYGTALAAMGRDQEALTCFAQALRIKPGYPEARWHQALTYLHKGDYIRGWPEYEWRWRRKRSRPRRFKEPLWDGSSLEGKTILLWCEQGLGDSLQFIRYAPLVKQMGGTVLVECQEKLMAMFFSCAGIDQVILERNQLPPFDVQAPMLTLPGLFNTRVHSIPADIPYLHADSKKIESWREELHSDGSKKLRVGIAWQGNSKHRWDRHRSFALEHFHPLARLDGVQLYSLQKGVATEDLSHFVRRYGLIDLSPRLEDLADTAAVMRNLDLVITCDSAPAHLAGALGVPTWVLLATMCDWRWLRDRDDSPWYPTLRLFRQKRLGDWQELLERVTREMDNILSSHRPLLANSMAGS